MKKKIIGLVLAAAMLAGLTIPAIAAENNVAAGDNAGLQDPNQTFVDSPSGGQEVGTDAEEIEVVTDNVVTGGYIFEIGTPEPRPLEQINYPVIKVTTIAMSIPSNAKVDAANPDASAEQKAGMMTDSGLSYRQNATVNEVADSYYTSESVSEFIGNYEMSIFDKIVSMVEGRMANYSVIQIADISANSLAISSSSNDVRLTFTTPGVKVGSRVMVGRIRNGSLEFVSATAGNGSISFNVNPNNLGIFVLMTCVEQ